MMGTERASIFGDDDLDVSAFAAPQPRRPTPAADKDAIREVAEKRGFQSRELAKEQAREPATAPAPVRQQRRHTTGRNRQLNVKATEGAIERFYAIADAQGWVLGEAFEQAVAALESQVRVGGKPPQTL